jgi:hypothetical protein
VSGYTRQSTADIIPTATVRAAPLNAEYNALRDAFAASGGHKHDGTTGEGDYVPLIADLDANNKVQVNTSANTVDFYVEVSSVPVEQISIRDGVIRPITDNDIDLGAAGSEFKDLYIDGIGYIDTLAVHENATVAGTLNVTGVITAPAGVVANITGNLTGNVVGDVTGDLTGDVTSTGTSTFADLDAVDLSATGTTVITSGDINSGTIDNSVIGSATPAAGTFTTLTANTSLTAATADINGGTLDGVVIGSGTSAAATVTDLTATGTSTLSTVDINAGAIDGTAIGAAVPSTGAFTTVSTTGQATLSSADINGGAIDGTTIGASVPATGAFTTVSASGGVTANVTGNLTGNVTGNVTGAITGNVTGDLTGNVTSAGSSSFNNVTIDGTLNMNAGTTATITNLTSPTNANDAATKGYVDQEVSALVDSAPGTLDTLNELAAALGDDADFSTTITNSIATKLPLAGGTMSGEIAMGSNKITGVTDPTGAQDASTKAYTDAQRDTRVAKVGDTMSGALAMGDNKVTGLATPTAGTDATNKTYVDGIVGSSTAAATSATNAATSETNAATSETNAATSETNAATSATNAAASYDNFDDRYLGAKSSAPTVDNDGDALITGALYFNSTSNIMYVYSGAGWQAAGSSVNGTSDRQTYTATAGQTVFAATYDTGYIDVYLNGIKLAPADFTATNGTSVTLTSGAAVNDIVDLVAYGTFVLADHYTEAQSDARYVQVAGDTMTGGLDVNIDGTTGRFSRGGTQYIEVSASSGGQSILSTSGANKAFNVGTTDSNDLRFQTDSAERMRIDSSGNLLVGKSVTTFANNGIALKSSGETNITRNDGVPVYIRRNTSDGDIVQFWKDGSTVGSIGSFNGMAYFASGDVGIRPNGATDTIYPTDGSGAARDNAVNFGDSGSRFKDLYLSGDANVGGEVTITGSLPRLFLDNTGDGIGEVEAIGLTSTDLRFGYAQDNLVFRSGSAERMRIDSSGRLLVGLSSSGNAGTIEANGTIISRGQSINTFAYDQAGIDFNASTKEGRFFTTSSNGTGGFTSFYTGQAGGSEKMRIDASGNLLVGQTTANSTAVGMSLRPSGEIATTRDGANAISLNRKTSDGDIALFKKDGTTVGSIGSANGVTLAIDGGSNRSGLQFNSSGVDPRKGQTIADNSVDLGQSAYRFKDAHFSGTVNAGSFVGDGSALTGVVGSTTAGAVGTYVFARGALSTSARQFVWNTTYAGSGLYPAGPSAYHGLTGSGSSWNSSGYGMAAGYYLASALTGTWRCLGHTHQTYENPVTLFVRIS